MTRRLKYEGLARLGFGPEVMKKTRVCPVCGTLTTGSGKACPCCGEALPALTLLAWYERRHPCCSHCGTVLSRDCRYCPQCGKRVSVSKEQTPSAAGL